MSWIDYIALMFAGPLFGCGLFLFAYLLGESFAAAVAVLVAAWGAALGIVWWGVEIRGWQ